MDAMEVVLSFLVGVDGVDSVFLFNETMLCVFVVVN